MADIYDTFRDIGIIPVVAIEDASKAANLAHALYVAEIAKIVR